MSMGSRSREVVEELRGRWSIYVTPPNWFRHVLNVVTALAFFLGVLALGRWAADGSVSQPEMVVGIFFLSLSAALGRWKLYRRAYPQDRVRVWKELRRGDIYAGIAYLLGALVSLVVMLWFQLSRGTPGPKGVSIEAMVSLVVGMVCLWAFLLTVRAVHGPRGSG